MTAVLAIAVTAGAGFALFNAHAAPAPALSPEPQAREPQARAALPSAGEESNVLSGSVLETMAASQYTYLRLATANGEIWTAVPSATVAVGAQVTIENASRMVAFKSTTLKRTFDVIYFGTLAQGGAQKQAKPGFSPADALDQADEDQELPPGHPDIGGQTASPHGQTPTAASPAVAAVAVTPAVGSNARAIAQLATQQAQLVGKRVRIRGQVTKVTAGVQGRTFFHLRDGNPSDPGPATDLIVTSDATPERGQIATFEGTLRTDADVGIGFKYPILLENAVRVGD